MQSYVKPVITVIDLRPEEGLASLMSGRRFSRRHTDNGNGKSNDNGQGKDDEVNKGNSAGQRHQKWRNEKGR